MLEIVTHFFEKHIAFTVHEDITEEKLRVASAALLMEMLHAEEVCTHQKQQLIFALLENTFGLSDEQATALIDVAERKRLRATDYFEFTHLINDAFSREQKLQLIESLWKIALIDANLDVDEEYLIDKIARLIYIPHAEVVQAKIRVTG
jgi:uncharacterized tellurite resistance protein B-like protein